MRGLTRVAQSSLIGYVSAALIVMGAVGGWPVAASASFVGSEVTTPLATVDRAADLTRLKAILEQKVVAQRLADFGLTATEIASRMAHLSDAQIHQARVQLDSVQPGGDSGLGLIIGLLVIAILVVVLLQVTGNRVIITK
jgi:hypothetical protein